MTRVPDPDLADGFVFDRVDVLLTLMLSRAPPLGATDRARRLCGKRQNAAQGATHASDQATVDRSEQSPVGTFRI
jgi:hypothetical protein